MAANARRSRAKMGSKWTRGTCPDPNSWQRDLTPRCSPPHQEYLRVGPDGHHIAARQAGAYSRHPRLQQPDLAQVHVARHHDCSREQPPLGRALPALSPRCCRGTTPRLNALPSPVTGGRAITTARGGRGPRQQREGRHGDGSRGSRPGAHGRARVMAVKYAIFSRI
jgi:hypothetical protein